MPTLPIKEKRNSYDVERQKRFENMYLKNISNYHPLLVEAKAEDLT